MTGGFERAAWSWVDHVRGGGSTPWLTWAAGRGAGGQVVVAPGPLPGAAELELVRRLAERSGGLPATVFTRLADVVLSRSGPGRGAAQLPLLWPPAPAASRVGAPPVDPARVPADELARVGVGALAELLIAAGGRVPPPRRVRRRPWDRSFRLVGAPVTVAAVRAGLRAAGHVEGGRRPRVLLFTEPFDVHLAQVWSARVQRGAPLRWETFVGRWARRRVLPPSARLVATARTWADRVGPHDVHVVSAHDPAAARRTAAEVLGVRIPGAAPGAVRDLSPAGTDVLRRLNRLLGVRVAADARRPLLRRAAALVDAAPGAPLTLPDRHRGWAESTADRLVEGLQAGGYAVHGDLHRIAVRHRVGPTRPRDADVLDLVLGACLALADPPQPDGLEAR